LLKIADRRNSIFDDALQFMLRSLGCHLLRAKSTSDIASRLYVAGAVKIGTQIMRACRPSRLVYGGKHRSQRHAHVRSPHCRYRLRCQYQAVSPTPTGWLHPADPGPIGEPPTLAQCIDAPAVAGASMTAMRRKRRCRNRRQMAAPPPELLTITLWRGRAEKEGGPLTEIQCRDRNRRKATPRCWCAITSSRIVGVSRSSEPVRSDAVQGLPRR
jgi:hypothetical protein